jgi:DNA-binding transcriptional LysR family regulator
VNLASIDLNRLLVLHAVISERSVTRAAAALHVTPSAVSNALARLRATFDDPLLVRSGRGLVLTPRAARLAPQLADAVSAMARVVEEQSNFAPARTTRTFGLACSDAEQISEVPRIAAAFSRKLPNARLRLMSVDQLEASGGLAAGDVDAAIAPASGPLRDTYSSDLYQEEGVLVVRKGHPYVRGRMSKDQFNTLRHIDILLALGRPGIGHRILEEFLASHGLQRDIAISVPSFSAAAAIAARTDWVAGMPRRMATIFLRQLPLVTVKMPVPPISFRMQLVWHERTHADAGARFFRSLVLTALRTPRPRRNRDKAMATGRFDRSGSDSVPTYVGGSDGAGPAAPKEVRALRPSRKGSEVDPLEMME